MQQQLFRLLHGGIFLSKTYLMDINEIIIKKKSSKIIFITGGTKSGKSEFAEHLANKSKDICYIAL